MLNYPPMDADGNLDLGPPWTPPPSLTVAIVLKAFLNVPRPWLADVINFMAFGERAALTAFGSFRRDPDLMPNGRVNFENVAQRMRAAKALCAAGQLGMVKFIGSRIKHGDASDDIPAKYFDTPPMLDRLDNSIGTNLHEAPMDEYCAAREGKHQEWRNVRAEGASFVEWLKVELEKFRHRIDLSALIRAENERKGCNLIYKEAEKIAKDSGENFPREIIRKKLKGVQGPPQRGRPPLPK